MPAFGKHIDTLQVSTSWGADGLSLRTHNRKEQALSATTPSAGAAHM